MARKPATTTHHVAVVNDHAQHRVVPGQLVVGSGDQVIFHSVAAGAVRLIFPTPVLADPANGKPLRKLSLAAGGEGAAMVLGGEGVRPGSYTYLVYCEEVDELAIGGSQPKIIIYR